MEKAKEVIGMLLFSLLFGLFTVILIFSYFEDYNLKYASKEETVVIEKVGEKGLFTPPAYFVKVKLPNGEKSDYLHRISKNQMKKLEPGDRISGFSTSKGNFHTIRDFLYDSMFYSVGILVFGLFTFLGLFVLLTEIPAVDRFLDERTFLGRRSTGNGMKTLAVVMAVFIYFSGRFLSNLFQKLFPFMKTKTEAVIIDQHANTTYRRYEDSSYHFTLLFEDENGMAIRSMKHVTNTTYSSYNVGDSFPISYRNSNPYDVFVNHTNLLDVIPTLFYVELLVYSGFIACIIFTGCVLLKRRKSKQ